MTKAASTLAQVADRTSGRLVGDGSLPIEDVTHDSHRAGPGVLFVAVRGSRYDGHDFVPAAIAAGSPAVMVEVEDHRAPHQVVVGDTREAMAPAAALVHADPSHTVAVVGVTGTNGKTTVTHYLESMLTTAGKRTGLIGTIRTRVGDEVFPSARTTPESSDFQRLLARMRDHGAEVIAAEVSSHALELHRVDSTRFAVAAFTNLSQDHLDFHGTMESYRRAKERLFRRHQVDVAVINVDDPVGAEIAGWATMPKVTVGAAGEVRAESVVSSIDGARFDLVTPLGTRPVHSRLIGQFNVDNALVAVGCCLALGVELDEIGAGLARLDGVPGRFERVTRDEPVQVIVDYAHTPTGVERAVEAGRALTGGRVIAVVGAGGDRDREKRPLMGRAAGAADLVVVTSDNPRSEDPDQIMAAVAAGLAEGVVREVDRRRAIALAVERAAPGDVVLILGKGHETGQEVDGVVRPFDDREVAREVLRERFSGTGPGQSGTGAGSE